MEIAKIFFGDNHFGSSFDKSLFNNSFFVAANQNYSIIKSKKPMPYQDIADKHIHNNYEFTIPLYHNYSVLIENKKFTLPRRNIFPTNPGQIHSLAGIAHQHMIIAIQVSQNSLEELAFIIFGERNVVFQNISVPIDLHMEYLIDMFIYESNNKQSGSEFILDNLCSLLGVKILRTLNSNLCLREQLSNNIVKKDIYRAIDYLHANFNQDFSLTVLSKIAGFSKYHLIRVFKKETGKTPYNYFIDLKLEKAIELIKMKNYSITDICFMCGFKDHSHFSNVFRKKTGVAPSIYKVKCN